MSVALADQDLEELVDLLASGAGIAAGDSVLDAMGDVIAQQHVLDSSQGGSHGMQLPQNLEAIAILLDHPADPANLALDPAEAPGTGRFCAGLHLVTLPM
jgi:hypothetical protein